MKSKPTLRTPITLALTLVLMAGSAYAFAQSTPTVTTEVGVSSRNLTVTDLAGSALTQLALTPGRPRPFKVSVTDANVAATDGFTVQSVMNNLYLDGDGTKPSIPSSEIEVSYPATPVSTLGNLVELHPDYLLSATTAVDCSDVVSVLGGTLASLLTAADPLCVLFNTIGAISITDVPLDAPVVADIDLAGLSPADLPVGISEGATGFYTSPDCTGIAATHVGCAGPGTAIEYLLGSGLTGSVTTALDTVLQNALGAVPGALASVDGTGAVTTTSDVLEALNATGSTALSDLAGALASYTPQQQADLINQMIDSYVRQAIEKADLTNVFGTYNAFPMLTVDTSTAPAAGSYSGTLTITLVD